jgi:catechol 2,3-dioxygenase-like lactoylglutathione lyase family enzyme
MKLKSGAGHGLYVKNIDQTIEFYTKLGLELKEHSPGRWVTYINWYRIDFIAEDTESPTAVQIEDQSDDKGAGAFFYFSVDNVDATYKELLELP